MGYKINKPDSELNLAPMIDIVFLLLIFFIVGSTLNIREVKKNIQLPDTEVVANKEETKVNLSIAKDGGIYLGQELVALENLQARLEAKLKQEPAKTLTIFADKEVDFQQVIKVMDVAKKANIDNLSFALRRRGD